MSWLTKLTTALGRSRESLAGVETLALQKRPLDGEFWDELEEILIAADFGVPTAEKILTGLRTVSRQEFWGRSDQAVARFKLDVRKFLTLPGGALRLAHRPSVILVVGVNGSGKTTTIGKLGRYLSSQGKRVMFVGADTFRAAAAEQLGVWAERCGAEFVRGREGSDPASVVFDGMAAAKARKVDVVLIDTAGRLQTKSNLMEELKKMRRIIEREMGAPPDETLLVVDGTTGQNAISQAKLFNEATTLTGVVVTKLDSTSKGGVLVAIVDTLVVPIKFIGLGEGIDELRPFDPSAFIDALFRPAA
ncbi:MAG: signal recognition particle-docking protein FtsY [Candidatus Eremiobacteraeota bacterium]|nr:signal recognition particle-docking protein FtsY [Candidatus Eremiobacteraeota bacterium]